MKPTARVEALVWLLIYVGLLAAVLGLFVAREGGALGTGLVAGGVGAAAAGVALIVVRSRMKE